MRHNLAATELCGDGETWKTNKAVLPQKKQREIRGKKRELTNKGNEKGNG